MLFRKCLHCVTTNLGYYSTTKIRPISAVYVSRFYVTKTSNTPYNNLNRTAIKQPMKRVIDYIAPSPSHGIHESISGGLQLKKRAARKKRIDIEDGQTTEGVYTVMAFATAEEYDLEKLMKGLKEQDLYDATRFLPTPDQTASPEDVVHAVAKYQVGDDSREIYIFREGTVVLWNISDIESSSILAFLRQFEHDSYSERLVLGEVETMSYQYAKQGEKASLKDSTYIISGESDMKKQLQKYAFSNAMALSVKLGVWEASLQKYIDSVGYVPEDLKRGSRIKMSRQEVLRKTGELFTLRHFINLSSDLLDTPDFYWDREDLEDLYTKSCAYFSIARRTRVMNEKLNHCVELAELISSHLNDKHHIRLEWMIIVLIMVEVGFEIVHYVDRYM